MRFSVILPSLIIQSWSLAFGRVLVGEVLLNSLTKKTVDQLTGTLFHQTIAFTNPGLQTLFIWVRHCKFQTTRLKKKLRSTDRSFSLDLTNFNFFALRR
jgi:hypothetical protein